MKSRITRYAFAGLAALAIVALSSTLVPTGILSQQQPQVTPTKNVDQPWRTPFETRSQFLPNALGCLGSSDCFSFNNGPGFVAFDLQQVPAGKRWVVQSATGEFANGSTRTTNIELGTFRGGVPFDGLKWVFGGPYFPGTVATTIVFNANLNVTFGPGERPFVRVTGSPTLTGQSVIVFSGYLIDATE